jgi:serine/threonine protein phosphatase PrpC
MVGEPMPEYRSFACFTIGANHVKNGLPCQDHAGSYDRYDEEKLSIAAVADGHGSSRYFRSDIGSKFAVEHAIRNIKEFVSVNSFSKENVCSNDTLEKLRRLAGSIIGSWMETVESDEKAHPFKEDERVQELEEKYKDRYLGDPELRYIHQAYGATLIAVAMTESYWFGIHVGDGKCQVLFEDGSWAQPIPWDNKCFLNKTTSLCDENVLLNFRYWFGYQDSKNNAFDFAYGPDSEDTDSEKKPAARPSAIFINTDGVDDSYPVHENEKHLESLYNTVVSSIAKEGFDATGAQIPALAKKFADEGSLDDVSIAGVVGKLPEQFYNTSAQQNDSPAPEETIRPEPPPDPEYLPVSEETTEDSLEQIISD